MTTPRPGDDLKEAMRRTGSFWGTVRAVLWSFFGVRKGSEYDKDVSQLNPLHVIVAGVLGAAIFVVGLLLLVNWVVASGVAGS
ncbi:Protein of unknown function [Roseateles sp. YR242]|uniref:DUF2970 domain-containing protein n=1 Tax=Roseateles sp. YR242 TaxID=1855305 RepID=UPI0008B8CD7F|nr:DUF2970 domain-containing protein [Roseateles sp. YR242]SEK58708.1 Protein of unknown function [Roseateles sp. YR242]